MLMYFPLLISIDWVSLASKWNDSLRYKTVGMLPLANVYVSTSFLKGPISII